MHASLPVPATPSSAGSTPWFQRGYRRMLVDMHIGDWDDAFLAKYDPARMAKLYQRAGLTSVMLYCQSHVGLCYWPTQTGKMHAGLKGRDIVAEMLCELRKRQIAACGYYSVVFNNWAFLEHPEWRMVPAASAGMKSYDTSRYGNCCPNHPGYRDFTLAQVAEMVNGYDFDGLFFDMTFWPHLCVCEHCRARYRTEAGTEIPETVDWCSPNWCRFQAARERWMTDYAGALTAQAKSRNPQLAVYHNFAAAMYNWPLGLSFASARHHDFLGADFYGDALEQFMVSKLMFNLSPKQPVEFMTSCCVNLRDHVRLKSPELMEMQAFAGTLFSAAFLFIDAINLDGTVNPATYERIRKIYRQTAPYEPYLGGAPLEDIGLYFSSSSKMDFTENGRTLADASGQVNGNYPHARAMRGWCRILQQAHLPFGVITCRQLPNLDRYKVIILPEVERMEPVEANAFREYVRCGGRLYASRCTSLTGSDGTRYPDFLLNDLFGAHFAAMDSALIAYLKPAVKELTDLIQPQAYVSHQPVFISIAAAPGAAVGLLQLKPNPEGKILATLTLPYASPQPGTIFNHEWASIHSSPPWEDTARPVMLENQFGKGRVIYSAADLEAVDSEVNDRLLRYIVTSLLEGTPAYAAETHPAVWMNGWAQPEKRRLLVGFLNYQAQLPALPITGLAFTLRPPPGQHFVRLLSLPDGKELPFTTAPDGSLQAKGFKLKIFRLFAAEYE